MNTRKKNNLKEFNTRKNAPKFDSKVNLVGDKIRFKPFEKQGQASSSFRFKKANYKSQPTVNKNHRKIHSSYRSYKVGEMPNVQISIAHVLEPLVEICCFDKELSSQFFTIFLSETISKNKGLEKNISEWFVALLKNSPLHDFSFISTLQKCLISLCEQGDEMIKINMNEIAIKSNTIDYAIVFTEENLIKYRKLQYEKERISIIIDD